MKTCETCDRPAVVEAELTTDRLELCAVCGALWVGFMRQSADNVERQLRKRGVRWSSN